jgi:hypothetical protein
MGRKAEAQLGLERPLCRIGKLYSPKHHILAVEPGILLEKLADPFLDEWLVLLNQPRLRKWL